MKSHVYFPKMKAPFDQWPPRFSRLLLISFFLLMAGLANWNSALKSGQNKNGTFKFSIVDEIIYLTVENRASLGASPRAKTLARTWLKGLESFEHRLADDSLAEEGPDECPDPDECVSVDALHKNRRALLKAIHDAKKYFTDRAR